MNESRFIELLNLYVDHQLTPAEAAELERDIQRNPQHRLTYQQYCRMQKACTQLFENERVGAPASSRLARAMIDADRKVVGFPDERRTFWARGLWGTGLAAAAACATFLLVHTPRIPSGAPANSPAFAAKTDAPGTDDSVHAVVIPAVTVSAAGRETFTLLPFRKQSSTQVAEAQARKGSLQLQSPEELRVPEWYQQVELRPITQLPADQFAIVSRTRNNGAVPASLRPIPAATVSELSNDPLIGFRFTK